MHFESLDYTKIPELSKKMKSFFCEGRTTNTTAYMNWKISKDDGTSFWNIAEGYFGAAKVLISKCLEDNFDGKADIFIFPILFDIVHGIELSLKAINNHLEIILRNQPKIEGNHNIKQMASVALRRLEDYKMKAKNKEIDDLITAIKLVQQFIEIIYDNTDDMAFARYSINTKNEDMFYTSALQNVTVDIELLQEELNYVVTMLDFIFDLLRQYIRNAQEI